MLQDIQTPSWSLQIEWSKFCRRFAEWIYTSFSSTGICLEAVIPLDVLGVSVMLPRLYRMD